MRPQFGVDLGQFKDIRDHLNQYFAIWLLCLDVNIILTQFANHEIECDIFLLGK